jgi:hypothetical protein
MKARQQEEAIFWCGLLAPVLFGRLEKGEERRQLREIASKEVVFPNGRKRKPSLSTLKRKLNKYRQGGFEAMARRPRNDRGKPRAVPPEVIATAIAAKKEQPRRSPVMLNQILEQRHGKRVSRSTLYRHLKEAGATRLKLGVSKHKVRKRWTCEHTYLRGPVEEVLLYSLKEQYPGKGILHQREEGQDPADEARRPAPQYDMLGMLIDKHRKELGGIDYSVIRRPRRWPFDAFAACLADLLGRRGALSAFNAEELNALKRVHDRHPALTRTLLKKAFARAERPSIPAIVYALQKLKEQ